MSGVVGLLVGVAWETWVTHYPSPPWAKWILAAALAVFGALFQAFHTVRLERDSYRPELFKRDWPLSTAVKYLREYAIWRPSGKDKISAVFDAIRQAALDGKIIISGRARASGVAQLMKPFPREFWETHSFKALGCVEENLPPELCCTLDLEYQKSKTVPPLFENLHVEQIQIIRTWPPRGLRHKIVERIKLALFGIPDERDKSIYG